MKSRFLVLSFSLAILLNTVAANAASCQCVEYIKKRINFNGSLTGCSTCGAYLSGEQLVKSGYKWNGDPQSGDIAVFQRNFQFADGGGVDKTSGHIAFVENASYDPINKTWTITFWGANHSSMKGANYRRSDSGCDNVTTVMNRQYTAFSDNSQRTISFYRK